MMLFLNLVRVVLAGVWTTLLGTPLIVALYARYAYGLLRATLGRRELLDQALEANARLAGWVAQRLWAAGLLVLAGVRLRVRELAAIDWGVAHVICANHNSLFDILALIRVVPPPFRFVAKRELLRWPFVGWALRPAGQIVIDRADRANALRNLAAAARRKIRGQVIFFVEGTRSRTGVLQPFKKGAFHFAIEQQLPILPTTIRGSYAVLAKLPWWRLRTGREIEVLFGRPIEPPLPSADEPAAAAVQALLGATRDQIPAALAADAA